MQFTRLQNGTLAYEFQYPLETVSGKPLNVIFSRKPERYSSAAPLTSDARQRIVAELVNLLDNVTMSVSVSMRLSCYVRCILLPVMCHAGCSQQHTLLLI